VIRFLLRSELDALLEDERPDVIIHPCVLEGAFLNDLIVATQARGIPFVVIMNSWDNPSTKQAMAGSPDYLLVWGEQTKRHAIEFVGMPAGPDDQVWRRAVRPVSRSARDFPNRILPRTRHRSLSAGSSVCRLEQGER